MPDDVADDDERPFPSGEAARIVAPRPRASAERPAYSGAIAGSIPAMLGK